VVASWLVGWLVWRWMGFRWLVDNWTDIDDDDDWINGHWFTSWNWILTILVSHWSIDFALPSQLNSNEIESGDGDGDKIVIYTILHSNSVMSGDKHKRDTPCPTRCKMKQIELKQRTKSQIT